MISFNKMKIGKQFNIVYVCAVVIPVLALGVFLILNTYNMLLNHHRDLLHGSNNSSKKIMKEVSDQIYNISDSIAYDSRTVEVLGGKYGSEIEFRDAARAYTLIDSFVQNYSQIGSITIYTTTPYASDFKYFKTVTDEIKAKDWYQKAVSQYSPFYQLIVEPNSYKNVEYSYSLVRKITVLGSSCEAIMVIKVSENYLESRLGDSEYITLITFADSEIFYSNKRSYYGKKLPFEVNRTEKYYSEKFMDDFEGVDSLVEIGSQSLKVSDTNLYVTTIDKKAIWSIMKTLYISLLIVIVALVVPAVFMIQFSHNFVSQVNTLRDEMHKASNEDYNILKSFSGSYELQQAYGDLLVMVDTIEQQKVAMYEAMLNEKQLQNEQQEMEFKMLASQINPHFLYNTLETLRMKAFTAGDREVATGIKLLGKLLRYVLVNIGTTYTTLANELVVHGLEGVDGTGYIKIHIYEKINGTEGTAVQGNTDSGDGCLIIEVSDNGNGMTKKQLEEVRNSLKEDSISKHSSIGMSNIDQRIKLCYGNGYGVNIDSVEGEGTMVTVILPNKSKN